jgi:hypothetical protein
MPQVECGHSDGSGYTGSQLLAIRGPTLLVDIGFDPDYDPAQPGKLPKLAITGVEALIDTGATISCIDKALAAALKLPAVDKQKFGGAAGLYEAEMHSAQIHVPSLVATIHGLFAAVDLVGGGQRHVALIGRTFLQNLKMAYDGTTGKVTLSTP